MVKCPNLLYVERGVRRHPDTLTTLVLASAEKLRASVQKNDPGVSDEKIWQLKVNLPKLSSEKFDNKREGPS